MCSASICILRRTVRISTGTWAILRQLFRGVCKCVQENSSAAPQIMWDRFLTDLSPIYYSPFILQIFKHRNSRTLPIESLAHDNGRTLVCGEYGYPKGSPNTNGWRKNPPLQLSIQCSLQHTSKWPSSKLHGATKQQAIAKTSAKWYVYQIPSVIVVFVILVFKA
jgi:hypothetical protein